MRVCDECNRKPLPMVVVDASRTDIVLSLLLASQSHVQAKISGVLLTNAATMPPGFSKILKGIPDLVVPVLMTEMLMYSCVETLRTISPTVTAASTKKLEFVERMFEEHVPYSFFEGMISQKATGDLTPKLFQYSIFSAARAKQQHIILPEGDDKRVVAAAGEIVKRGLARITILGNIDEVRGLASRLQIDLTGVDIIDPSTSPDTPRYSEMLYEARKAKGMAMEKAEMLIKEDPNYYATMMMYDGVADGMVSGACHTTADTMRPALQIIKTAPGIPLVSSVFFMLLPQKVFIYGDCAINVAPNSEQLAFIAMSCAKTASAFGIKPRVALLSYATGSSGKGDQVDLVKAATAQAKAGMPESTNFIEGPLQFDAAVDPEVAKIKVKTQSEVAGQANVCVFPDLNTGNNAYKAVQQSSGCIAMGPIMQGLRMPVNDLSRGCTITDIVNTVVITCVQSIQSKQ